VVYEIKSSDAPPIVIGVTPSSWFEVLAVIMASAVSAAALGLLVLIAKRLGLLSNTTLVRSREPVLDEESPAPTETDEAPMPATLAALYGDPLPERWYVDLPSLEDLAADLGIPVDRVRIEQSLDASAEDQLGAQLSAALDVPSIGSLKATIGGAAKRAEHSTQSVSLERRTTFRELLGAICSVLDGHDRLETELLGFPDSTTALRATNAALVLMSEWGLTDFAPPPADPAASVVLTDKQKLSQANALIYDEANRRTYEAKLTELRALGEADPRSYVLASSEWVAFTPPSGGRELWTNRVENFDPADRIFPYWVHLIGFIARAPLDETLMTSEGRAHLLGEQEMTVRATIFGKVLGWDAEKDCLVITPLAVYA
jgi:hypothetical protein